jgi:hypothetical protein
MTSVQSLSLTEASSVIGVAIICEAETTVFANSLDTLLERERGFAFSRFEYSTEFIRHSCLNSQLLVELHEEERIQTTRKGKEYADI